MPHDVAARLDGSAVSRGTASGLCGAKRQRPVWCVPLCRNGLLQPPVTARRQAEDATWPERFVTHALFHGTGGAMGVGGVFSASSVGAMQRAAQQKVNLLRHWAERLGEVANRGGEHQADARSVYQTLRCLATLVPYPSCNDPASPCVYRHACADHERAERAETAMHAGRHRACGPPRRYVTTLASLLVQLCELQLHASSAALLRELAEFVTVAGEGAAALAAGRSEPCERHVAAKSDLLRDVNQISRLTLLRASADRYGPEPRAAGPDRYASLQRALDASVRTLRGTSQDSLSRPVTAGATARGGGIVPFGGLSRSGADRPSSRAAALPSGGHAKRRPHPTDIEGLHWRTPTNLSRPRWMQRGVSAARLADLSGSLTTSTPAFSRP